MRTQTDKEEVSMFRQCSQPPIEGASEALTQLEAMNIDELMQQEAENTAEAGDAEGSEPRPAADQDAEERIEPVTLSSCVSGTALMSQYTLEPEELTPTTDKKKDASEWTDLCEAAEN